MDGTEAPRWKIKSELSEWGPWGLEDVRIHGIPHHPRRSPNTNDWMTGHLETATRIRVSALGRAAPHAVQKDAVRLTTVERSGLALLHMFAHSRAAVVAFAAGAIQTARAMCVHASIYSMGSVGPSSCSACTRRGSPVARCPSMARLPHPSRGKARIATRRSCATLHRY